MSVKRKKEKNSIQILLEMALIYVVITLILMGIFGNRRVKFDYGNMYKTYSYLQKQNAKEIVMFYEGYPLLIVGTQDMNLEQIDKSQDFINKIRPYVNFKIVVVSKISVIISSVRIGGENEKTKGINYSPDNL